MLFFFLQVLVHISRKSGSVELFRIIIWLVRNHTLVLITILADVVAWLSLGFLLGCIHTEWLLLMGCLLLRMLLMAKVILSTMRPSSLRQHLLVRLLKNRALHTSTVSLIRSFHIHAVNCGGIQAWLLELALINHAHSVLIRTNIYWIKLLIITRLIRWWWAVVNFKVDNVWLHLGWRAVEVPVRNTGVAISSCFMSWINSFFDGITGSLGSDTWKVMSLFLYNTVIFGTHHTTTDCCMHNHWMFVSTCVALLEFEFELVSTGSADRAGARIVAHPLAQFGYTLIHHRFVFSAVFELNHHVLRAI